MLSEALRRDRLTKPHQTPSNRIKNRAHHIGPVRAEGINFHVAKRPGAYRIVDRIDHDGKPLRVRTLYILGTHALNIGVPAHAPKGAGSLDCIRTAAFGQKPAGVDGCRSAKDGKRRAAKGGHQGQTPLRLRLPQPLFSVY